MVVKDFYHDIVVRALIKAGWKVPKEQFPLVVANRRLWVDIQAANPLNKMTLIEVKGFSNPPSPVDYLEEVMGQYVLYQGIIDEYRLNMPLYLAVPLDAIQIGILGERIGKIAIL